MSDIADLLGVSIVYLSDIERGNRAPLSEPRIRQVAAYLGVDPGELLMAAAQARGVLELDVSNASAPKLTALAGMARGGITDDQWLEIIEVIEGRRS